MFYKLSTGDGFFLVILMGVAAAGFLLPHLRESQWAGVALFGWWMAILMFWGPLIALIRIMRERRKPK